MIHEECSREARDSHSQHVSGANLRLSWSGAAQCMGPDFELWPSSVLVVLVYDTV